MTDIPEGARLEEAVRRVLAGGEEWSRDSRSGYPVATSFLPIWREGPERPPAIVAAQTKSGKEIYLDLKWEVGRVRVKAYDRGRLGIHPFGENAYAVAGRENVIGRNLLTRHEKAWRASAVATSISVVERARREGVATALYDVIDYLTPEGTAPSEMQTGPGAELWRSRLQYRQENAE